MDNKKLIQIPAYLTDGIIDVQSLQATTVASNDSDEISCGSYDCEGYTCDIYNVDPCSTYSSGCDCDSYTEPTPQPPTEEGTLTIAMPGSDYVFVRILSIPGATKYQIIWENVATSSIEGSKYVTSTGLHRIDGLSPNTTYIFNYCGENDDGAGPYITTNENDRTVTTLSNRPTNWSWQSNIQQGTEINISANEWKAFCNRINEFRVYKNFPEYGAFINVSPGDFISADVVNHAAYAIGAIKSSAMDYVVYPDDFITADIFNGLKNVLNSIE